MNMLELYRSHPDIIWENTKTGSPSTAKHLAECMKRMEDFCCFSDFGHREIDNFKPLDIKLWLKSLEQRGLCGASQNRYLAAVSRVFNYSIEYELMDKRSPVLRSHWRKPSAPRPLSYTPERVNQLIRFFRLSDAPWMADMAVLSVNTGMRLGEILMLDKGEAEVKTDDDGDRFIWLPETKNGDPRKVYLNQDAEAAVEALAAIEGYYSHRKFYDTWTEARRMVCGGDKNAVFHTFRHTAATKMANDLGINTELIGKVLGHRCSDTTNKYIKLNEKTQKDVARLMAG